MKKFNNKRNPRARVQCALAAAMAALLARATVSPSHTTNTHALHQARRNFWSLVATVRAAGINSATAPNPNSASLHRARAARMRLSVRPPLSRRTKMISPPGQGTQNNPYNLTPHTAPAAVAMSRKEWVLMLRRMLDDELGNERFINISARKASLRGQPYTDGEQDGFSKACRELKRYSENPAGVTLLNIANLNRDTAGPASARALKRVGPFFKEILATFIAENAARMPA